MSETFGIIRRLHRTIGLAALGPVSWNMEGSDDKQAEGFHKNHG
jgi:hypothetical protein